MKNWTRKELKAYLLIYAMNADLIETTEEIELIKSKVDSDIYDKMHLEFEKDNDYNSIEKINNTIEKLGYCQNEIQKIFDEIKEVYDADSKLDLLERNIAIGLKRILCF